MSNSYSVDFLFDAMRGKSVDGKSHRRGEKESSTGGIIPLRSRANDQILPAVEDSPPLTPTKDTNKRRYGFINFRNMFVMLFVLSCSSGLAHEGFNVVLKDAAINPYTVTVLEDTHIAENQTQMNMMIQVAHGRDAAPADTKVFLTLEQDQKVVYNNEVNYVASSSSDGRTFYAYYIVTIPLSQQGMHQARLELDGSLGNAMTTFQFDAKAVPDFRAIELIPSLLIISICLVGLALFFFSSRTPLQNTTLQQDQKGLHHA